MKHRRSIGCLILLVLATSGCATQTTRALGMASGGVLAVVGTAMIIDGAAHPDSQDSIDSQIQQTLGLVVALTGAAIATIASSSKPPKERPLPVALAPTASMNQAAPGSTRPLPGGAGDATTLRLARQARRAAMRLDCTTVEFVLGQIFERDPGYQNALVSGGTVAPCR